MMDPESGSGDRAVAAARAAFEPWRAQHFVARQRALGLQHPHPLVRQCAEPQVCEEEGEESL